MLSDRTKTVVLSGTFSRAFAPVVFSQDGFLLDLFPHFEMCIARVNDMHELQNPAGLDLPVWRFDESIIVDACIAAQ